VAEQPDRDGHAVPKLTLETLDRDGAILEAIAATHGATRADFLRSATVGGAALLAALSAPPVSEAKVDETAILNYGLTFEYLQATFYTETDRVGTVARMGRRRAVWARTLGAHERAHVRILKKVLGGKAVKKPAFDFGGATEAIDRFTRTAVAMEDLTVALLTGQVPRVETRPLRAAFFSLLTVEARHAAWARRIVGATPVARPLDEPKTLAEVQRLVASTHFIASKPRTTSRKPPKFTG
jgi:hypothetical protein